MNSRMKPEIGKFLVQHESKRYDLILAIVNDVFIGVFPNGNFWKCSKRNVAGWVVQDSIPEGYVRDECS